MSILAGPFLKFVRCSDTQWVVSAIVVADQEQTPTMSWSVSPASRMSPPADTSIIHRQLVGRETRFVHRFQWTVPRAANSQTVDYAVEDRAHRFTVPGNAPPVRLRMGYASCNGFHSAKDAKRVEPNVMWGAQPKAGAVEPEEFGEVFSVLHQHAKDPIHLLLLGGDQVYADPMWETVEELRAWAESGNARLKSKFNKTMEREVPRFYFELYMSRWSRPAPALALASIPSLMMWDDHDIFDGWGSYDGELQESPVYQGVFRHARAAFEVFQLHRAPADPTRFTDGLILPPRTDATPRNLTFACRIGDVGILALDTRSDRSTSNIIKLEDWKVIFGELGQFAGCKHLLVMVSIPVSYPSYPLVGGLLGLIPGRQDLEDDLRDHWRTRAHREERLRLIHRLLDFASEKGCRVTLLSGDVHVAAMGVIESNRRGPSNLQVINQLISSPIVNVPQTWSGQFLLEQLGRTVENIDRGITARMLEFSGTVERFIAARNWLSLQLDEKRRVWAEWRVENETEPYTKVIHPAN